MPRHFGSYPGINGHRSIAFCRYPRPAPWFRGCEPKLRSALKIICSMATSAGSKRSSLNRGLPLSNSTWLESAVEERQWKIWIGWIQNAKAIQSLVGTIWHYLSGIKSEGVRHIHYKAHLNIWGDSKAKGGVRREYMDAKEGDKSSREHGKKS